MATKRPFWNCLPPKVNHVIGWHSLTYLQIKKWSDGNWNALTSFSSLVVIVIKGSVIWGSKCHRNNSPVVCDGYVKYEEAEVIVIKGSVIWGSKCHRNNSPVVCDGYVKYEEAEVDRLAVAILKTNNCGGEGGGEGGGGGPCGIQWAAGLGKGCLIKNVEKNVLK